MHILEQVNPRLQIQQVLQESAAEASQQDNYVPSKQMEKLLYSSSHSVKKNKRKAQKKHLRKAKKKKRGKGNE